MTLTAPHTVEASQIDLPNRRENEVLLKVSYGGICGTDLKIFEGQIKTSYPLVMGHEIVGSIVERPDGIEIKNSRVIVDPVLFCGNCFYCKNSATNLCHNGILLGRDKQGGFGEFVAVPASNIYGLPDSVNDQDELTALSSSVLIALKDVVSLTGKLTDSERSLPEGLPEIPRELSFWIASHLGGSVADEQQSLLEMLDTKTRLKREYDMLDQTRRQLAARTALKETLSNADPKN